MSDVRERKSDDARVDLFDEAQVSFDDARVSFDEAQVS